MVEKPGAYGHVLAFMQLVSLSFEKVVCLTHPTSCDYGQIAMIQLDLVRCGYYRTKCPIINRRGPWLGIHYISDEEMYQLITMCSQLGLTDSLNSN